MLRLLSAGAAQGVAVALAPKLLADTGCELRSTFLPVGALKERFLAGEACDVVVSTPAMLETFARECRVDGATLALVGRVHAGIAVRKGDPPPLIDSAERLRAAIASAPRIHVPDPQCATAGIHFVKCLRELDLFDATASRLATHPSGVAAMLALAASGGARALGCTQATEILCVPGVELVGALPEPFDLVTAYAAAISASARDRELARRFVAMLTGEESAALRRAAGFEF